MSVFLYEVRVKFFGPMMDEARFDEMAEEFEGELLTLREKYELRYGVETEVEV
jgi:hypothetical protein